jgi:hypothetical protein
MLHHNPAFVNWAGASLKGLEKNSLPFGLANTYDRKFTSVHSAQPKIH